nr:hypothetical protein [Tanacetum cinerariifolium]
MTEKLGSLGIRGQKPKWAKDYEYHKEKMVLCKQESKGVSLSAEQDERKPKWAKDYEYHKEKMMLCKQESKGVSLSAEQDESNATPDSSYVCDNEGTTDQNDKEPEDERVVLACLIANFNLDIDEKKSQKQLKKANTFLTQDLEKSKQDLEISKQDLSYCK